MQSPLYTTAPLHDFLLILFEQYAQLLESQFSRRFEDVMQSDLLMADPSLISPPQIVQQDDHIPMQLESDQEVSGVLEVVWVTEHESRHIREYDYSLSGYSSSHGGIQGTSPAITTLVTDVLPLLSGCKSKNIS